MHDDGWVDESYYVPPCPPELRQEKRKKKKKHKSEPVLRTLMQRRRLLDKLAADPHLPISDRQDARRLLEIAEIFPREFERGFTELHARTKKETPMSNPFRSVLQLGYDETQQGKHSAYFVLLSLAADVYDSDPNNPAIEPGGSPLACPMQEVIRRLGKFADTHFIKEFHQSLPVVH